ncbi:MAG: hypothetical protein AAGE65_02815 [Planctomycetota bacterium]
MLKPHLFLLLLISLLAFPLSACAQVAAVEQTAPGTADATAPEAVPVFADTLWLANGTIKLGVSPSVGRITWFGYAEGENLLWINPDTVDTPPDGDPLAWINYGGDKLWPSPQPLWPYFLPHGKNWPPDGTIDGEAWHVLRRDADSIRLRSPYSPVFGGHLDRTIEYVPNERDNRSTKVRITNRLVRTNASAMPAQAWTVTQTRPADEVWLEDASGGRLTDGWIGLDGTEKFGDDVQAGGGFVRWINQPAGEVYKKLGTLGGEISARYGDTVFSQRHRFVASGSYPEHSSLQLYVAGDYIELEMLSPMQPLLPGETLTHVVEWSLNLIENPSDAEPR